MARKSGSAKKAAKRTKERQDAEQHTLVDKRQHPSKHLQHCVLSHQLPLRRPLLYSNLQQPAATEQQAADPTVRRLSFNPNQRRRGAVLRQSILKALALLHDFQQHKYQPYALLHTDVEVFRECKNWLWQTYDCVPEFDFDDEYIDP